MVKKKKKIRNNIPRLYTLNYYKTHVDFLIKFLIKKKLPVINSLYSHKFLINSNLTHQNPQILSHTCLTRSYHLPISIPNFILFKDVAKNSHVQNFHILHKDRQISETMIDTRKKLERVEKRDLHDRGLPKNYVSAINIGGSRNTGGRVDRRRILSAEPPRTGVF